MHLSHRKVWNVYDPPSNVYLFSTFISLNRFFFCLFLKKLNNKIQFSSRLFFHCVQYFPTRTDSRHFQRRMRFDTYKRNCYKILIYNIIVVSIILYITPYLIINIKNKGLQYTQWANMGCVPKKKSIIIDLRNYFSIFVLNESVVLNKVTKSTFLQ